MNIIESKGKLKYLYLFWVINIISMIIIWLLPAHANQRNREEIILLNMIFIIVVSIFYLLSVSIFNRKNNIRVDLISYKQLKFNINLISFCSILGFFMMVYDRIFIRGIDYTLGLRNARYQWLSSEGGSFFGVLGNLLIPFGYVGIFFLIYYNDFLSGKRKIVLVSAILISIVGHAALNGGRSNILILLILAFIIFVMKKKFNQKYNINKRNKYFLKFSVIFLLLGYITFITASSASLGNISMKTLTELGIKELYGEVDTRFFSLDKYGMWFYYVVYFMAYLFHGQWTAEISFSLSNRIGNYTFNTLFVVLNRLGIPIGEMEPGFFSKTGAFISLPGSFYYDYGYLGVVILSSLLGIIFGLVIVMLTSSKSISLSKLAIIIYILFIIILSPMLPAYGFIYLNFLVWAFVIVDIINRIFFRKKVTFI